MEFQQFNIFPTTVLRFNTTSLLSKDDIEHAKSDIDSIIDNKKLLQINDRTPNWQSIPVLFRSNFAHGNNVWSKLKQSFESCCQIYLQNVKEFCNNQEDLSITGSRAWFYKKDKLSNNEQNPWHNHYPSLLSGVFYLDANENPFGGTEFHDPRVTPSLGTRNVEVVPILNTWVIFPGWMVHRTNDTKSANLTRYVIAADLYVKVY